RARMYLVGSRLYQVFMAGPTSRIKAEEIETFFNSFELLEGSPTPIVVAETARGQSAAPQSPFGFYTIPDPATAKIVADREEVRPGGPEPPVRPATPGPGEIPATSATTATTGGASIPMFRWLDADEDVVGGYGDAGKADGAKDQHLQLVLDLPPNT